jgi:hypothetical protein
MGSLGSSTLAFIFPPIFYVHVCRDTHSLSKSVVFFNYFLVFFGAFGAIFSMTSAFINMFSKK